MPDKSSVTGNMYSESVPNGAGGVKKSKKKLFIILGSVFGSLLLIGGLVAFLVINSIKNRPENILAESIVNTMMANPAEGSRMKMAMNMKSANPEMSEISEVNMSGDLMARGQGMQMDLILDGGSMFKLQATVQMNEDGNTYLQVRNLAELLSSSLLGQLGMPEEFKAQLQALDGKWIKVTPEDLKEFMGDSAANSAECSKKITELSEDEKFGEFLTESYKNNMFFKSNGAEDVDLNGRKLMKIDVAVDQVKLRAFMNSVIDSEAAGKVMEACGVKKEDIKKSVSGDSSSTASEGMRNTKFYAWVNKSKRELVKMEMTGDQYTKGTKEATTRVEMEMIPGAVEIKAPTDAIGVQEVLQQFNLPLQSSLNGGTVQVEEAL